MCHLFLLLAQEQGFDVAVEKILRHITRNRFLALLQHVEVPIALFSCNFVSDVEQLPNVGVKTRILLIVP